MNKLYSFLVLLALSLPVFAQNQPPDCPLQQGVFSASGDVQFDNRNAGCDSWTVFYVSDSALSFTVEFQSANGQSTPGSFSTYAGNTSNSSASFGTAQFGLATYCGLATCVPSAGVTVETAWVRVDVSGVSGSGTLRVYFYGYRTGYAAGLAGGGGGGGGSGCPNPCPVVGTAPPGSPPSGDPVQIAGSDGTDIRTMSTDSSGVVNVNVKSGVQPAGRASFASGQAAVTASAANLGSNATSSVCVHALIGNTINIYAGASGVTTSTGMELPPGQGYCWNVSNTNLIYVIASTTGASVSFTY